ncbi:MAG: class I SAM-dependent methyltransferase [Symploca sp. SIO1A3]|nr:class I SAM-dependent methyltransferase [Symploca sp. SIO1A3]
MAYDASQWEVLATAWREWEHLGMTISSLRPFLSDIKSPILVIGAGQGIVVEALMQSGHEVVGVDGAQAMITQAKKRRGIDIKHALGQKLPFDDQSFTTVILATGVLYANNPDTIPILTEAIRVLKVKGQLLAGFYLPSETTMSVCQEIGYMEGNLTQPKRLLEIWAADRNEARWVELVKAWKDCSQAEATECVERYHPLLYTAYADWERFAWRVREQGYDPKSIFQEIVNSPSSASSMENCITLFSNQGLKTIETHWESEISNLTLMGYKT